MSDEGTDAVLPSGPVANPKRIRLDEPLRPPVNPEPSAGAQLA